jgi:hypothetical protein
MRVIRSAVAAAKQRLADPADAHTPVSAIAFDLGFASLGPFNRALFDFLTTVAHHDLHHGQARWNCGLYSTWWDRLMGTEHPDIMRASKQPCAACAW